MGAGIGNGRGGPRHGAGRPKGVQNKRRPARLQAQKAGQQLPLDYMLEVLNDKTQPTLRRDRMAIAAAPYLHPRLNMVAIPKTTFEMTTVEIDQLLARELEHAQQQGDTGRVREIEKSLGRYAQRHHI